MKTITQNELLALIHFNLNNWAMREPENQDSKFEDLQTQIMHSVEEFHFYGDGVTSQRCNSCGQVQPEENTACHQCGCDENLQFPFEVHNENDSIEGWHIDDVFNQDDTLTKDQARQVLQFCKNNHDAEIGINWGVIDHWIDHVKNL